MPVGNPSTLFGPLALTATLTTNIYVPPSALIDEFLRHLHIVNKTGSAHNFSLYLGATGANAAGTELFLQQEVRPYSSFDWYCNLRMTSTTYLVGGADALTSLVITGMGEKRAIST